VEIPVSGGSSRKRTCFCQCCMVERDLRGPPAQHAYRCARCVVVDLQLDICYDQVVCDTSNLTGQHERRVDVDCEYYPSRPLWMNRQNLSGIIHASRSQSSCKDSKY
jgi:hypothetical protein